MYRPLLTGTSEATQLLLLVAASTAGGNSCPEDTVPQKVKEDDSSLCIILEQGCPMTRLLQAISPTPSPGHKPATKMTQLEQVLGSTAKLTVSSKVPTKNIYGIFKLEK